ncbi:MAG TPA: hypothetical protein VFW07_04880 [Parafilimonas sp.]|nr:hypothetical protein [Parafilimonas sp.]
MKLAFDPVKHGWHFPTNVIADAMGIKRSNGLCGGMSLAAVNYFRYGVNIPSIGYDEFKKANMVDNTDLLIGSNNVNPVLNFILNSQFAVFESPDFIKQKIALPFPNTKGNHHYASVYDEFPKIKKALDNGCFVIIGLRSIEEGNEACHQTLVYGYNENNSTLYMYDSNNPDEEVIVKSDGYRLIFSNGKQYYSYYLLMTLNPEVRSNLSAYNSLKNQVYNFSVRPPLAA